MNQPATQTVHDPASSACEAEHYADDQERQQRQQHIEQLEDQITELAAHIHAATYRLLELIREYDACDGWSAPGLRSCAHWLNWKCGIDMGAAREKVRVARALKELPRISALFRKGRVSYSKVRAMTRVATRKNERYLLMIARHGTAHHVERAVRSYRKVKRIEALDQENTRHEQRELSWYVDDEGYWVLRGRFPPEQGALIQNSLQQAMEENFQEQKNVAAETCRDQWGEEIPPAAEPIACRRADALARMAQAYGSGEENTGSGGDRFLVHVHTDVETLKSDGTGAQAELENFGHVAAATAQRLACDAGVVHWLDNADGSALDIGRKTRSIPPAIRRALQRRDGGCRFPGCTCSRFVDAHHIRHWADGGETSLQNLALLCRRHHRLVHEGGFAIRTSAHGAIEFTNPAGAVIPPCAATRCRGNVFSLFSAHEQSRIHITPDTTIPNWYGEKMDDELAVLGMLQLE